MPKHFAPPPTLVVDNFEADTISEETSAAGVTVDGFLIKDGGFVASGTIDANAVKFILDADQDTSITADTDDQIDIEISGADDFRFVANIFRALSGSVVETNTINETTAASGVTIDSVLVKDGGVVLADLAAVSADVVSEKTAAHGVIIDGLTIKDGVAGVKQAITGDGAITIQNAYVVLSKGSAAAITLAAPTSGTHDGIEIVVIAISAQAHVITGSVDGFNAKGSSGTATFGGAIGDSVTFRANGGHWYTTANVNVTIA